MPEPKKFISEFGKIGNNLNQIARHFNSGGIHSQEMRKAIGQNLSEIFKMKKEVLKMAGDFQSPDTMFRKFDILSNNTDIISLVYCSVGLMPIMFALELWMPY